MITTIIFDLDGLLSDTETLHIKAYQQVFEAQGYDLTEDVYSRHWIRDGKGVQEFIDENKLSLNVGLIRSEKAKVYDELLKTSLNAMPGAKELLMCLRGHKRLALASSFYRSNVEQVIRFLDFNRYFDVVAAYEDVKAVKPAPDLFLYVAERMNVNPSECIVVEDAEKGIIAASVAGMKSIAVPSKYTRENDFSLATHVCDSLLDVEKIILRY
ncbi:MAG: HAD family phosphatase [Fibrobacteres bacterium]|nr:HAD family phosphatase [Fibrobacterota bacterium]